jgi:hypothetical protein
MGDFDNKNWSLIMLSAMQSPFLGKISLKKEISSPEVNVNILKHFVVFCLCPNFTQN